MSFKKITLHNSKFDPKTMKAEITIMNLDGEIIGAYDGDRLHLQNLFFNMFNDAPELIDIAEHAIESARHLHKLNKEIEDYQQKQNQLINEPNKLQEL